MSSRSPANSDWVGLSKFNWFVHRPSMAVMDSGNLAFHVQQLGHQCWRVHQLPAAFNAGKFSGRISISSISWDYWPFAGPAIAIGGNYTFYWDHSAVGLAFSSGRFYLRRSMTFAQPAT